MEPVTITGQRGLSQMEVEDLHSLLMMIDVGIMVSITMFMNISDNELVAVVALTPCGNPKVSPQAYQTTSHEEIDELRWAAATQIIGATIGRPLVTRPLQVTVMYSDGGTERMQYATMVSAFVGVPGTLKKGDGIVGSACRGSG